MIGILIALLSGALMSIQGVFNTEVTKTTGIWLSAGFVQLTALIVCVIGWWISREGDVASIMQVRPRYLLTGGILGALITFTVIKSMAALGPAKAVLLIVVSQLIVAYVIELFGWFLVEQQPFEWRKLIGMVISILGIIIFKYK
ncbi:MAG: DMT family transporter [Clostridia bacterium]|nr:DMT family transporter [Clostridia bacterium]